MRSSIRSVMWVGMRVTFDDIADRFEGILSGELSREDADRWAAAVMQADEAGTVEFLPHQDLERIWRGLTYLLGVDMPDPTTTDYLHSLNDIRIEFTRISAKLLS